MGRKTRRSKIKKEVSSPDVSSPSPLEASDSRLHQLLCALFHFQVWEKNSVVCYYGSPDSVHIHPGLLSVLGRVLRRVLCCRDGTNLQLCGCVCARYFYSLPFIDSQMYLVASLFKIMPKTGSFSPCVLNPSFSLVLRNRDIRPTCSDNFLHRRCESFLRCGLHAAAAICFLHQRLEDASPRPHPAWLPLCASMVVGRCVFVCAGFFFLLLMLHIWPSLMISLSVLIIPISCHI